MADAQASDVSVGDSYIRTGGDANGITVVKDTVGAIFLGLLAVILLIALLRSNARNRDLLSQLMRRIE